MEEDQRELHGEMLVELIEYVRAYRAAKAKAMEMLRSKLYDSMKKEKDAERSKTRKALVGSGDRSERIRTYNFPQDRITDHRIQLTLYKIEEILSGDRLNEIIDVLLAKDESDRFSQLTDNN